MTACNCDRLPRWRVREERWFVDVSEIDWSEHPAWGSDFPAEVMRVDSLDVVPDWADDPFARRRVYECRGCGSRQIKIEPFDED